MSTKIGRRFRPPTVISRPLLETESSHVLREISNYLVCSTHDLRNYATTNHQKVEQSREQLEALVESLPLRERLAVATIVAKDLFVAIEAMNVTILTHLAAQRQPASVVADVETPVVPQLPKFNEWLFMP